LNSSQKIDEALRKIISQTKIPINDKDRQEIVRRSLIPTPMTKTMVNKYVEAIDQNH
jgi:hypothetical protein